MSDTNNKSNTAIACGNLKTDEKKSISIEYGTYGPAKNELINLAGLDITCGGTYKIEKDPKTGKILRIQDGRTLSEMSKEKYEKIIKAQSKNNKEER